MFPTGSYDLKTVTLLTRVSDAAWSEVQGMLGVVNPITADTLRARLATRLMAAVNRGERDPARLKLIALNVIEA